MIDGEFEWDDAKAEANFQKHGVDFLTATKAFRDAYGIDEVDDSLRYGEQRFRLLARVGAICCSLCIASAAKPFALFQQDKRRGANMTDISVKTRKIDGKLVRVHADGREEELIERPIRPMTDDEIHEAASSDPDALPLTPEFLARMRRVPQTKVLRRALGLSQDEFAARFHIPVGTLRDWEQGRFEPDAAARAYLKVIGRNPQAVMDALQT